MGQSEFMLMLVVGVHASCSAENTVVNCLLIDPIILIPLFCQVEVNGDITSLPLTNLISQSEYDVAVTPVYDEGVGNSMLGQAITGTRSFV